MLVKINKPLKGYGYFGGETAELPDDDAKETLTDVKGIGNASACRIIEFCENYEG